MNEDVRQREAETRAKRTQGAKCLFSGVKFWRIAALLFLAAACAGAASAQPGREDFIRWAKAHAVPLQKGDSDVGVSDLPPLKPLIGAARVVALGEPAHGAHEPLAFRNRLFRFLVEEMGFTAIALETGFAESRRVADFIAGGAEDVNRIARECFWGSQEGAELLLWMRAYNANPAHRRKLRFYGVDLSLGGMGNAFPTPAPIEAALAYLTRVDADSARRLKDRLKPFLDRLPGDKPPSFTAAEHDQLTAAIGDLVALLERERLTFTAATSESDYEWALQSAVVARYADQMFRVSPEEARPGAMPPDAWKAMSARDAAMAANVRWALKQEGSQGRLLVFAHNAHVKNASTEGGVWGSLARPPNATGQYLRAALGEGLLLIGMCAGGSVSSLPELPAGLDRLDAALAAIGAAPFVLDLRAARRDGAVAPWLARRHAVTTNMDTYLILSPLTAFDLLYFADALTPMKTVPPP